MRVLHVMRASGVAGAERHLLALLAGLRARGHDARLALLTARGNSLDDYRARLQERGIPVHVYCMRSHVSPLLSLRLAMLMRRLRPQIVHTHLLHADLHGALAARLARVPALVELFSRHLFPRRGWALILWRLAPITGTCHPAP